MFKLTYSGLAAVALFAVVGGGCTAPTASTTGPAAPPATSAPPSTSGAPSSPATTQRSSASPTRVQASPTGLGTPLGTITGKASPGSFNDACSNPAAWRDGTVTAGDSTIAIAEGGQGATVAIFLHQTTDDAMCGWAKSGAGSMVRDAGIRAILMDLCPYGRSRCTPATEKDHVAQVKAVVDHARATGATRVTLVGASLGGMVALEVGAAVGADAIVDVSGPTEPAVVAAQAPTVTMPALFVFSPRDQFALDAVKAALPAMPATQKELYVVDEGHGYEIVRRDQVATNKIMAIILGRS